MRPGNGRRPVLAKCRNYTGSIRKKMRQMFLMNTDASTFNKILLNTTLSKIIVFSNYDG